jgi:hypothetical protein
MAKTAVDNNQRKETSAPNPGFARSPEGVQENLGAALHFLVRYDETRRDWNMDDSRAWRGASMHDAPNRPALQVAAGIPRLAAEELCCIGPSSLAFLLKALKHEHSLGKLDGVDGAAGAACKDCR